MKNQIWKSFILGAVFLGIGVLPICAQDQPQKLTVKAQEASIYAKPEAGSQVIEKPSAGSVYEIVRKVGEWYEIKLPSRLGMVITGYIQEKYVDLEKPVVEEKKEVVISPGTIEPTPPLKSKIGHISLGGLYNFLQMGYDYAYPWFIFNEDGAIHDSVDSQNPNAFGFALGLGFFVLKNIEIDVGFHYVTKTLEGFYAMDLPNKQKYSDIAYAEASANPKMSEMMFHLGVNFHPSLQGRVRPYLGAGISYINGKMDLLDDIIFLETFYLDKTHDVEIKEVKFTNKTLNALGFYGKAGIDLNISSAFAVFGEGQYLVANKEVPHPLVTKLSGHDELLKLNLGGATAILGVKIRF